MINFNAFPFYQSLADQWHRKSWCHNDTCTFKLYMPQDRLLPFQLVRPASAATIVSIDLFCLDSKSAIPEMDILAVLDSADLTIETSNDIDWITYFGNFPFLNGAEMDCGIYNLIIEDSEGVKWYSEVFHVVDMVDDTGDVLRAVSYGNKVMPETIRAVDNSDDRKVN